MGGQLGNLRKNPVAIGQAMIAVQQQPYQAADLEVQTSFKTCIYEIGYSTCVRVYEKKSVSYFRRGYLNKIKILEWLSTFSQLPALLLEHPILVSLNN